MRRSTAHLTTPKLENPYDCGEVTPGLLMVNMRQSRKGLTDVVFAPDQPLGVQVLTLHALLSRPDARVPARPHRVAFHHLLVVTRGHGTHMVDFVQHRLRPGLVLHVAPGQVHQFGHEAELDAWLVVFQPDFVRRTPPVMAAPLQPSPQRLALVTAMVEALAHEVAAFDGSERARVLLHSLVESLGSAVDVGAPAPDGAALLDRFRGALQQRFRETHDVAAYADILCCSTRTLTRHCERWAGRPAKRFIDERVVLEAKRLLAHGDQSVAAIAIELGFAEPTQFVKYFRRLTGDTPASFRAIFRSATPSPPAAIGAHRRQSGL